jgi:hypothetical protein
LSIYLIRRDVAPWYILCQIDIPKPVLKLISNVLPWQYADWELIEGGSNYHETSGVDCVYLSPKVIRLTLRQLDHLGSKRP